VGIDLGAQGRKDLRQVLHLVQDDEAVAHTGQEDFGLGQHGAVGSTFQVQEQGLGMPRGDGARQRHLAYLARPEQRHGGGLQETAFDLGFEMANDHC